MTKVNAQLKADLRTVSGRKVNQLRRTGILPATIYGHNFEPKSVQFNGAECENIFSEVGESGLVDVELDGSKLPVLLRNPQYDAVTSNLMHIDCYKVNLKEKITATVPLELVGEAPAVKLGNILVQVSNEIEVEALPADLPEKIEIDISGLELVDQTITVAEIKVDDKVEIKTSGDQLIVKLEVPKEEEEPVEETVAPGEVPATEQKTEEEKAADEKEKAEEKKEEKK